MVPSDDHYYQIQSDRSRVLAEKETLEKVYDALIQEHRSLQSQFVSIIRVKSFRESYYHCLVDLQG